MAVLSQEEFKKLAIEIKAMYPKQEFLKDQYAAALWYRNLSDIPYSLLRKAFDLHVQSSKFVPTVAELRQNAERLAMNTEESFPEFEEIWDMINKASVNASYNAEEMFEKLPDIAKKIVGTPQILRTFGAMEKDDFNTVQKSLSRSIYRSLREQAIKKAPYSMDMQKAISAAKDTGEKALGISQSSDHLSLEDKSVAQRARERFENFEDYHAETDNDFTQSLIARFGTKAPRKE